MGRDFVHLEAAARTPQGQTADADPNSFASEIKARKLYYPAIFLYGSFYDADRNRGASREDVASNAVVVYRNVEAVSRVIASIEGLFLCEEVPKYGAFGKDPGDPICPRTQMEAFEERYNGRFVPLSALVRTEDSAK